jgi:hypothetical protein
MKRVIDERVTEGFTGFFKRQRFFRLSKVTVGGRSMSLSSYENAVIRPLGEPRVHFALNCLARSCPRLPQEAFDADALEAQLESAAREFLNDPRNVRIDAGLAVKFITYDWTLNGRA